MCVARVELKPFRHCHCGDLTLKFGAPYFLKSALNPASEENSTKSYAIAQSLKAILQQSIHAIHTASKRYRAEARRHIAANENAAFA
jgi:hypothetical protein